MNDISLNDVMRESEERLRLAFWAANIGFWNWDLLTQEVYLSPIWKSQLGYEDHELSNAFSTWEILLHPEDRESSFKVIQEAQQDPQRVFELYFRLRHKDQSYRWLLSRGRVYRDAAGKPIRIMGCHVDVTQQKEDERLVRESESRLQTALEGGRMGMWAWDLKTHRTHWNSRELELLDIPYQADGYSSDQFYQRVHPDDRAALHEKVDQALREKTQFYHEFRVIKPNGEHRWLVGAGRALYDSHTGQPVQMIGVNYDITAAKEAHASMQEAHQFNKQIIINAQEGIVVRDQELRYQLWNPYMEQLTGLSEAEVLGKLSHEVFSFLKEQGIDSILKRALAGEVLIGKEIRYEDPARKKSGWTTARYGPLRNAQGQITGVIATIRDTTESKLAAEKLSANQQRLELTLQQLPSILWTTDRDFRFTSNSGLGLKPLGLQVDSFVGKTLQELMQNNDPDLPTYVAHRKALQGASVIFEQEISERTYQTHLEPLRDASGNIQGCIGVAIDVTDRKKQELERSQLEARIQQAQKLESLEVLAGGIAHDFNNLLTGMLGYASLALNELPIESSVYAMVKEIEKAAQRAAELSRQMLAYSGKGKFVIEVIELNQLVTEMLGLLKTIVSPKAQLHIVTQEASIEGDATQIRQVVMNLITNAADAIQGEGYIAVRTGKKTYSSQELHSSILQDNLPAGEYAYLEVQDNGCGIPADVLLKIFDPFFTTKFTGRGLGLASVLGIVRGHHGTIQVESQPNQGTFFRVLLPAISSQATGQVRLPVVKPTSIATGKLLIVEDDPSVLRLVTVVLKKSGYDLLIASDSRTALSLVEASSEPLLAAVIDLTMPHLNGLELSAVLHKTHPTLPILLMSGYTEEDVVKQTAGFKIERFLQKPFRAQELLASVANLVASRT